MNEKNLKSFNKMSEREQKAIASKGGVASGKAKRRKKEFKESLEVVLGMVLKSGEIASIDDIQSFADLKGKNITVQDAIVIAMAQRAMKGNVSCARWVLETSGQKQPTKLEMRGEINNPFSELTTEELRRLANMDSE